MDPDGGSGEHDYDGEGEGTHRYCGTLEGIGTAETPGIQPAVRLHHRENQPQGRNPPRLRHRRRAPARRQHRRLAAQHLPAALQEAGRQQERLGHHRLRGEQGRGHTPGGRDDDDDCGGEDGTASSCHRGARRRPLQAGHGQERHLPQLRFLQPGDGGRRGHHQPAGDRRGRQPGLPGGRVRRPAPRLEGRSAARLRERPPGALHHPAQVQGRGLEDGPGGALPPGRGGQRQAGGHLHAPRGRLSERQPVRLRQLPAGRPEPEQRRSRPSCSRTRSTRTKPVKMLRWGWSPANLADKSGTNPRDDARAHRGALNGDDLIIGYSWTPNWGRNANDKYDFYVRRSFNGGPVLDHRSRQTPSPSSTTSSSGSRSIDYETQTVTWDEEVVTTAYGPGASEPPRNVSNLRNNRISVLEPRLVKTPGTILTNGSYLYPEDVSGYQRLPAGLRPGVQPEPGCPTTSVFPKMPLDIYYSRTQGQGAALRERDRDPPGRQRQAPGGLEPAGQGQARAGCGPDPPDPRRLAHVRHLAGGG